MVSCGRCQNGGPNKPVFAQQGSSNPCPVAAVTAVQVTCDWWPAPSAGSQLAKPLHPVQVLDICMGRSPEADMLLHVDAVEMLCRPRPALISPFTWAGGGHLCGAVGAGGGQFPGAAHAQRRHLAPDAAGHLLPRCAPQCTARFTSCCLLVLTAPSRAMDEYLPALRPAAAVLWHMMVCTCRMICTLSILEAW